MSRFDYILHRADGVTTVELNSQVGTFRAVTSEKLIAVRQDVSSAELTLVSSEAFTVNVGDWIEAKGMRLYCMSTIDRYTCSEDNNREYQLTFYSPEYYLRLAIFYNTSENESGGVYSYSRVDNTYPSVGTFEDFVKLCCYNCNSVQGVRMFKVGTVSESIATDIRVLNFSDYNCLAVLKQTCEKFETTWRVRINEDPDPDSLFVIDFGVVIDDFPVTLEVEKSKGLLSIEVTASDKDVFTQFVIKGGTDNLPSDYPYPNLQLDEDLSSTPPILANSMIKLPDLYSRWGKSIKELTYEDIKPSRTGTVTSISENILKFTDSDLIGADWSPVGGTIHFVSGHLIGFTFNVQAFNSETGEITIESTEENNGFVLPSPTDSYYRINELDKYNIAGVSLPSSYITDAKAVLKERALLGIDYWSQPRMQYAITIDPKIISVEIVPNMGFHIEHPALGIDKVINVQQVVYDLSKDSPYDIEDIIISDLKTDDSKADTTHRQIATTVHRLDNTEKTTTSIKTVIKNLDTYIDGAFADGLVSEAEAKAIEKYINTVNSTKSDIDAQFTALYANSYLSGDPKTNLNAAKTALNTATSNLLGSINTAISDGAASAAEKADVDSKFTAFNSALSTYQTRVEQAQGAIHAAAAKAYTDGQLSDYAAVVTSSLGDLQSQIDGNITTWFYAYVPTTANAPASGWTTTALKNQHLGDLFYDTETGYCYRFQLSGETYSWQRITDTDITAALANAAAAQDTADNKRRVFVATPTTPYEVGDLWSGGESGDLKRCKVERLTGDYNASDWELATKYTDNTEAINAKRDAVNAAKEQADAIYTKVYANAYLTGDPKTNLNTAKTSFNTAVSELLSALSSGTDVESKIFAYDSAVSAYYIKVQEAQEAISAAIKTAAENAAKSYAEAQDLLRKTEAEAYADGKATDAEDAAIAAAEAKVNAAKVAMEAYADGVVSDEEAARIADANAKYEAALNYADSLAEDMDADTTAKVTAAKNALAAKFGYTDWAAMEAAVSLISGMTTSTGLINANVIDVETLAALDAFIEELVVIKLETAVDEDGTKVRIDADAVDGRAGVLLEESTGNRGIKLYYKASNGAPIFYLYSTDTSEFLEFLANRMKFSKGTTRDATIDAATSSLQLRNDTKYAHISPAELRVDDLPDEPVGTGKFWVDTSTGIVHWGIVTPPTVTYSFDIDVTYPSGRSDIAASGGTATFTVKLITTTDGVPDAGVLVDLDTGYPSVASSPTGTNFSITRTGTGTYSISAASRGTVEDSGTAAAISVKYTPSGATQQSTSFNILQEANSKTKTDEDTGITLSISTIYDDSNCPASGDTWQVTASGESGGREEYTYTSGESEWVSLGGTPITASLISITTSGTGLSGSGTGAGTSVTWADRGTTTGERRSGTITASYSGESVQETVYQQYNIVESVTDKVINWVKLDGVNGNIEVDADAGYTLVTVELGYTNHYTSGDTDSRTIEFGQNLSVSGTGFTRYSETRVDYTENTAQSTRNGVVTITYGDATPVQRTITQAAASATTYQILGEVTYPSGSQIPASGGTATLTVTKQTYINGVHQSASDVLVDCDSGYPDLTSQPTGCDVSITRTGVGTYSLSAESRGVVVNAGTDIEIDLQATIGGSAKTDSVTLIQQANALASSTNYQITSVTLDGVNNNISITKSAQTITVLGSGTYTKTYTSGSSESATFNLGASDISVSGLGFSYSNFQISAAANSGAERTCTVTASYTGASNVTRTITQATGIVAPLAPSLGLDNYSLSGSTLTLKASISNNGGGTISACGFEHGDDGEYFYVVPVSAVQSGQFTTDVSVIPGQTIYWRAYATNEAGTTYTTITNTTIPE